jgi:pre-mRNA-splicing factor SYF2
VGSSSASLLAGPSSASRTRGLTAAEDLYRGADTLAYGDSKPSEDAVDRVIGKINKEWVVSYVPARGCHADGVTCSIDKGKRKKKTDEDEEVTYINDRNKVFNKKVSRSSSLTCQEMRLI